MTRLVTLLALALLTPWINAWGQATFPIDGEV